jgi:hypothetical protein
MDFNIEVKSITENQLNPLEILKTKSNYLNKDSLLMFFYPGRLYKYFYTNEDTTSVIIWNCPTCKIDTIMFSGLEDSIAYVDTVIYDTRLLLLDYFIDANNKRFAWFAANTTPYQSDFLLTGRFCSGILSLGLLKQETDGWRVVTYNNHFGCFGLFCMAPRPEIVEYKKGVFGLVITDYFGGFGGPFTATKHFFGFNGMSITTILSLENSDFSYTDDSYWKTEVSPIKAQNDTLELTTKGKLLKKDFEEMDSDFSILPDELKAVFNKKSTFSFAYIRKYLFKNNQFVLVNSNFNSK